MMTAKEIGTFIAKLPEEAEVLAVVQAKSYRHIFFTENVDQENTEDDPDRQSWCRGILMGIRESLPGGVKL